MILCNTRQDWHAVRSTGIGASEAAAILGVSPWKSALQLFYEKRGTEQPTGGETFARELGLLLEDPIASLYAAKTGRMVTRPEPGKFQVLRHRDREYMLATLDGMQTFTANEKNPLFSGQRGPLEIKTAAISKAALWDDEAPIDYQVQVQHQLAVTGAEFASVVALIGGVSLRWADIRRDPEFVELLEASCAEFWRRVELNDPPPADGTEGTKEFLKRLYPKASAKRIELPPEAIDLDAQREEAAKTIKAATARKLEAENKLKQMIGENVEGVLSNGIVFTWKEQHRQGYTVAPTDFRDFRRKGPKVERAKRGAPRLDVEAFAAEYEQQKEAEGDYELDI